MTTQKTTPRSKTTNRQTSYKVLWKRLEKRLLAIGGKVVVPPSEEPHLEPLLKRGFLLNLPVTMRRGKKSQCHTNSAALWGEDPAWCRVATGYALSEDGAWRQHSWVVGPKRVYETTVKRGKYFGVVLDEVESTRFWFSHYWRPNTLKVLDLLQDRAKGSQNGQPNGMAPTTLRKASTVAKGGESQ
jgi:hypothetical protein